MRIVDYTCPLCDHTSEAPLHRFAAGDAGIWVCPSCERAFRLQVEFAPIAPATIERATRRMKERRVDQVEHSNGAARPHLPVALSYPCD